MRKIITTAAIIIVVVVFNIIIMNQPETKRDLQIKTTESHLSETVETTNDIEIIIKNKTPYEKTTSKLFEEKTSENDMTTMPVISEPSEEETVQESSSAIKKKYRHFNKYIWVGDSRTEGMANSISIEYLAAGGKGLSWCKENMPEIYNRKGYNIIINFGINDLGNLNNYINYYNSLPEDFIKNNQIFILSVNPVDETTAAQFGYTVKNSMIKLFNEEIQKNLRKDIYFIDGYTYMQNNGFVTEDGVHYNNTTYVKIYNYVKNEIEN